MIYDNLKTPYRGGPGQGVKNGDPVRETLERIKELERTDAAGAIAAYHELLESGELTKSLEYQNTVFHLASCYEKIGCSGKALYHLAMLPYYRVDRTGVLHQDYLGTDKNILMCKAANTFQANRDRLNIVVSDSNIPRLRFVSNTLRITCCQQVHVIGDLEGTEKIMACPGIAEYDLMLLACDLFGGVPETARFYQNLKIKKPVIAFLLNALQGIELKKLCPEIEYYAVHSDSKFLSALVLMMLEAP